MLFARNCSPDDHGTVAKQSHTTRTLAKVARTLAKVARILANGAPVWAVL